MTSGARMVDVGDKAVTTRLAEAEARLLLRPDTLRAIQERRLEKGDALEVARTAAILAVKNTPQILPLTHPLPIEAVTVDFEFAKDHLMVRTSVRALAKTGVEMEALTSAAVALLTVWDLAKGLEKDANGQYPSTRLEGLRVRRKVKG